ncbi:hypothetical protein [Paracoccus sediminis]|jgi:hypothetical protein|uniref:VPEID-CTERM protein sorting domain-containing protein n=1 Tax=Paracoccus sediminis TaxID=1214787 RepID=A0A238Y8F3_9RHOB|nr:hypothetical protein [Paracoccus sediminis]SNR67051.1 VPEID-CTERM protein sorting domain-containing protein [Paracoccus sediminis]
MKTFALASGLVSAVSAAASVMTTGAAYACVGLSCPPPKAVPEISALEGTAALAALAAIVLLTWERRRRAQ